MTGYIAACRDIDPARLQALMPDQPLTPVYPGSVAGTCVACGVAVWVGPKAQEAIEKMPGTPVACFLCAAAATGATTAMSLGNTYLPKPGTGGAKP